MRWLFLTAALTVASSQVLAAEPAATGIISYPSSYFAEVGPTTAFDMVLRIPGFSFDKGTVQRGLEGSGGNVLIDGEVPVAKNDTLDETLKRIPAGSVLRVDVIRGGAPGIDMQGRSVVANVVRKSASGFRGAASLTTWLLTDHRTLNGLRTEGQWRWNGKVLELSTVLGKGPFDQLGAGPRIRTAANGTTLIRSQFDGEGGGQREWLTGAFETPLQGGRLKITAAYMNNPSYNEITDRLSFPGGKETEYVTIDKLQMELGGRYTRKLGQRNSIEVVAFQQWNNADTKDDFNSPAISRKFGLDKRVTETVGRLQVRRRQSETLTLEGFVEGASNALTSKTGLIQNGAAVRLPAGNVRVEESRAQVSVSAGWRPTPQFGLDVALRQESSQVTSSGDVVLQNTYTFLKPRIAVTWSPNPADQFRFRVEREVSQLNFDDFISSSSVASTGAVLAGNPNLSPQQAWVVEAAAERRFWKSGVAILTVRHFQLTDVIDRAPVFVGGIARADAPGNIGDGTKDELTASLAIPLAKLGLPTAQLKTQATLRRSEVTDPATGIRRDISILRPVEWEAHFTQDLPQWKSNWGIDVTGQYRDRAFRYNEIETLKIGTWIVAFIEYKPRPDLTLRVEAQNLGARDTRRIREVFNGSRGLNNFNYVDFRDLEYGPALQIRLRKAL